MSLINGPLENKYDKEKNISRINWAKDNVLFKKTFLLTKIYLWRRVIQIYLLYLLLKKLEYFEKLMSLQRNKK